MEIAATAASSRPEKQRCIDGLYDRMPELKLGPT